MTNSSLFVDQLTASVNDANRPLQVLLLTDSPVFAGTERHILDLSRGLKHAGAKVIVGCPQGAILVGKAEEYGINTLTAKKSSFAIGMVSKLVSVLRANEVDLIHAHNGVSHVLAAAAVALAGRGRCVATYHFLNLQRARRKGIGASLSRIIHAWAERRTSQFIAISRAVATSCEQFARPEKLSVIVSGIFPPSDDLLPVADVRAANFVPVDAPLVVSVSRLEPEKNVDVLIRAMALIVKEIPECICMIAGDGCQRNQLQHLIEDLNVKDAVHLVGYRDDVLSVMRAGDLFVLPCACEGLGLVLLEAMSLQKAVIAAGAGGPTELIENEVNGILFYPGDFNHLAASVVRLLRDRQLRGRLERNGRDRALERYNATNMTEQTLAVYAKAMM